MAASEIRQVWLAGLKRVHPRLRHWFVKYDIAIRKVPTAAVRANYVGRVRLRKWASHHPQVVAPVRAVTGTSGSAAGTARAVRRVMGFDISGFLLSGRRKFSECTLHPIAHPIPVAANRGTAG